CACRGARSSRRQRLRRRKSATAALPRSASQFDLGGIGQRDVPRCAARRAPAAVAALLDELRGAKGADSRLDRQIEALQSMLTEKNATEVDARRVAGAIAVSLAAGLLLRSAP